MSYSYASNSNLRGAQRGAAQSTATSSFVGVVRVDGNTMLVDANGTISVDPTAVNNVSSSLNTLSSNTWRAANSSTLGLVIPDGTSILVTSGVISANIQVATTSVIGTVKPDGTSIAISGGLINIATSSNGFGVRTISTSAPAGGNPGDIWYQV